MAQPMFVDSSTAVTNTVSDTITPNYPADSASGDLLVMSVAFRRSTAAAFTVATPSGWTLIDTQDNSAPNGIYGATFYRWRSSETSVAVTASVATLMYGSAQIHAWRGDIDATTPIDTSAVAFNAASSSANNVPTVTPTREACTTSTFTHSVNSSSRTHTWPGAFERTDTYAGTTGQLAISSATIWQGLAAATGTVVATASGTTTNSFTAQVAIRSGGVAPAIIDSTQLTTATTSTGHVVNYPAGSVSGDVLILLAVNKKTTGAYTTSTPSDWNLVTIDNQSTVIGIVSAVYWRVRGAETSVTVPSSTATYISAHLFAFHNADTTNPIANYAQSFNAASGLDISMAAVNASIRNMVITSGSWSSGFSMAGVIRDKMLVAGYQDHNTTRDMGHGSSLLFYTPDSASTGTKTVTADTAVAANRHFVTVAVQPPQNLDVPSSDSAAGTDSAQVIATSPVTDTAAGTEQSAITNRANEPALAIDSAAVIGTAPPKNDTAAATDTAQVTAVVPVNDTVQANDVGFVINVAVVGDIAAAIEAARVVVRGADTGTATESGPKPGQDAASATETQRITVRADTDPVTATDSAFSAQAAIDGDSVAATEAQSIRMSVADTALGTDTANLAAISTVSDSAAATETTRVIIRPSTDPVIASDAAKIVSKPKDTATATDSASIIVTVFATDSATAADTVGNRQNVGDQATATESAFKYISGRLVGPRITRVERDNRTTVIERESRTVTVGPQNRLTIIGKEVRRTVVVSRESRLTVIQEEA